MHNIILLVEDDEIDAMAVERAAMIAGCKSSILRARDGVEALEILNSNSKSSVRLVITDINMPRMNGIELLQHIRRDDVLQKLPVVVLTTSSDERDRLAAYNENVAGYMVKPVDNKQFERLIEVLLNYWSLSL